MESTKDKRDVRRQNIPIIYARGTHYEVGFDVVLSTNIVFVSIRLKSWFFYFRVKHLGRWSKNSFQLHRFWTILTFRFTTHQKAWKCTQKLWLLSRNHFHSICESFKAPLMEHKSSSTRSVRREKKNRKTSKNGSTFFQLFLFHLDEILPNVVKQRNSDMEPTGCSTVYVNGDEEVFVLTN